MSVATHDRSIAKLNRIFGAELGYAPDNTQPLYIWRHSDDLIRTMPLFSDGKPILDWKCPCGLNSRVHSSTCSLSIPVYRYGTRKLLPKLSNQYVLCRWIFVPELLWRRAFGSLLPWPENGEYTPVSAPSGPVALDPAERPNEHLTLSIIHDLKRFQSQLNDLTDPAKQDALERERERKEILRKEDMIAEELPLFNRVPGTNDGPVSIFSGRSTDPITKPKESLQ